ncbi:30S ribosomal protein S24e [Methanolapillus millepedarum]|uniref:Small ribosomal subunit protein eS24 n=1 Tax=Methanolapillus millepedarum TaxID=3028296 RepID=A0AA96V163_9EURY|nr:hypothetical protein MsAc7_00560 [Methanosarcinaceae archaeon Ac7]
MEITIVKDHPNKLLNRRELDFVIKYEGPTPSRIDVRQKLAALLNTDLDLTLVHKMESVFGLQEVHGYAKVYESADRMKQVEREYMIKRNTMPAEGEAKEE